MASGDIPVQGSAVQQNTFFLIRPTHGRRDNEGLLRVNTDGADLRIFVDTGMGQTFDGDLDASSWFFSIFAPTNPPQEVINHRNRLAAITTKSAKKTAAKKARKKNPST